ncbi:outer membrane beta-barrel protein [Colwellia sp. RE-S-Sl-9]
MPYKRYQYLYLMFSLLFISSYAFAEALITEPTATKPLNSEIVSQNNQLLIEVPYIELLSGPSAGYPVINVIEKNDLVTVLIKRTSWLKVEDKRGNQGWFHQNSLLNVSHSGEKVTLSEIEFHDYQQRTWEGTVMFGDFNGANFYNIGLGYVFSPVITSELSLAKSQGDISDSNIYELQLVSQPFPDLTVSPYFSVGLGLITTEPHSVLADAKTRENTLISSAIGGKYYLARNFVLRAEYKYSLVLTDRDDNEEIKLWKVGFSVFF